MQGGATPLFIASLQGHKEVVCLLSDAEADKDIAMQGGATPLFIASPGGHLEVVRLLSDARADRDIAVQGGAAPIVHLTSEWTPRVPQPHPHIAAYRMKGLHLRMNCWAGFWQGVNTEKVFFVVCFIVFLVCFVGGGG